MHGWSWLAISLVAACSPYGGGAFACDEDADCTGGKTMGRCEMSVGSCSFVDSTCPEGYRFGDASGDQSGQCVGMIGPQPDGQMPFDGPTCYGIAPMVCFTGGLAGTVTLDTQVIDTMASPLCSPLVADSCAIIGDRVEVIANANVAAIGARPLVIVANVVVVDGLLDVGSHRDRNLASVTYGATLQIGAAANDPSCGALVAATGVGGGAGGSFVAAGGAGGGAVGGQPAGLLDVAMLHGGCGGGDGISGTFGVGGHAGGAVYLVGETSIAIGAAGAINASGEAGQFGTTANAGAGGGGSGGMIRFSSPMITNAGIVFANGGGGGEGSGGSTRGAVGGESIGGAAAAGGTLASNGGEGGAGGAATTATGTAGTVGSGGPQYGGGGGGGSVGTIQVFGGGALGGTVSPPPSS